MTGDVLVRREGSLGRLTLNRPAALNGLTHEMCAALLDGLRDWTGDPSVHAVLIDAVPGRAFCAGGDIRAIYHLGQTDLPAAEAFFATEYRLNIAIHHFHKPYIAVLNGITMGGGAGVSIHGRYRLATENTSFAMPETGIGLYPDVGATFFLSRLPGETGTYLALTGARIGPADMCWLGLATHFLPAGRIGEIIERLTAGEAAAALVHELPHQSPEPPPMAARAPAIDRAFAADSLEEIVQNLGHEGDWGRDTATILAGRSPESLKLTLGGLRRARGLNFDDCMRMEYRMTLRVLRGHDLYEGVRAILIDRDHHPVWRPASLAEVGEEKIAQYFAPLGEKELVLTI